MPNTLLTINEITRKALMILEQKLNFIGNINRQYDSSFANSGAKIGDSLRIRLPNQYVVRDGAPLQVQETKETNTTLQVTNQKGVDLNFTSADRTLSLDDFTERILNPAMSVLSATMESDALMMANDVYNYSGTPGTPAIALKEYLDAKAILDANLCPMDNQRSLCIGPAMEAGIVDNLKGLFQSASNISEQYREGKMGRTAGFDWYSNTLLGQYAVGNIIDGLTVSGADQTGSNLLVAGTAGGSTFKKGTIIYVSGMKYVHPQTKKPVNLVPSFVITEDVTATGATVTLPISPAIILTGGAQNMVASPDDGAEINVKGTANSSNQAGLAFHKDAFTFATADLTMPEGVDFAAREVWQGLSLRVVRAYDINTDQFPCRLDILYGYKTLRPQMACRILS